MDRDWGSKPGSGGAASAQNEAIDRRERLRRLALETIDLAKDPYFMRNHLGRSPLLLVPCLRAYASEISLPSGFSIIHLVFYFAGLQLRVQALSHLTQQRGELLGAHTG